MSRKNKKIKYPDEFVESMDKYAERLPLDDERRDRLSNFLCKSSSKLLDIETAVSLISGWLKENVPETNENIREETEKAVREARKLSKERREKNVLKNTRRLYSYDMNEGNIKDAISTIELSHELISYADSFSKKEFFSNANKHFKEGMRPTPASLIRSFSKSEGIIRGHLEMAMAVKTLKKGGHAVIYDPLISLFTKVNNAFRDEFLLCLHTFLKEGGRLDIILEADSFVGASAQLKFFLPIILSCNVEIYAHNGVKNHEEMPFFLEMDRLFAYGKYSEENIDLSRGNIIIKNMAPGKIKSQYELLRAESISLGRTFLPENRREYLDFLTKSEIFLSDCTEYKQALPLFTMKEKFLHKVLEENGISEEGIEYILKFRKFQKKTYEKLLEKYTLTIFIPDFEGDRDDKLYPLDLSLLLYSTRLCYSKEDFKKHLAETMMYSENHPNFRIKISDKKIASSLEATLIGSDSLIITKPRDPAMHLIVKFEA